MSILVFLIGISILLVLCLVGALLILVRSVRQQSQLNELIIRSQNTKEIETYNRIASEYLHQNVINGCLLPHILHIKAIQQAIDANINKKHLKLKLSELMSELCETENIVRNMSEHIFPPHLTYAFVKTCQKHISILQKRFPNPNTHIQFDVQGVFDDLQHDQHILYNLYSILDLFVSNSLRHAQASLIHIRLSRTDHVIGLEISDNGIGFDMNKEVKGRGLADLRGRALCLARNFEFYSHPKGTYFKILLI
jgi:two-component system, NarL family, sensor histidine kinase LiaS